jgi:uncharacterized membrane protein
MSWYHPTSLLDKAFEGGVILKGIDGALELVAGLLMFFVSPQQLHSFVAAVTQRELLEDPHDRVANLLLQSTSHFSNGSKTFFIVYLWIHAIVKLVAVVGLLRNKMWAYPFSLITLGLLMLYQVYSIVFVKVSIGMVLLTIFDAIVLWLIWREYLKVRAGRLPVTQTAEQ